jgi:hypothetical protein
METLWKEDAWPGMAEGVERLPGGQRPRASATEVFALSTEDQSARSVLPQAKEASYQAQSGRDQGGE